MKLSKIVRFIAKTFLLLILIYGLTSVARVFFGGRIASASESTFYPQFCLGGWHQPSLSAGVAALQEGQEISGANSAFLESSVAAQLFCGYFNVESRELPPTSVKLSFLWEMKFKDPEPPIGLSPVPQTETVPSEKTVVDSYSSSEGFLVSPATGIIAPAPSSTPAETPENSLPEGTPLSPQSGEASHEEEKNAPTSDASQPEPLEAAPPQTPDTSPPPAPEPVSSSGGGTSLGDRDFKMVGYVLKQILGIKIARAQEKPPAPDEIKNYALDFLEVSYSLNGIRWHTLGRINRGNYKNFSVSVPLNSWAELQNLQITITPIPSLETKPDIYLNGVELRVEGERTASEVASDGVKNLTEAAQNTLDALDSARDLAVAQTLNAVSKELYYYAEEGQVKVSPTPPRPHLEKRLSYKIVGEALQTERVLPWHEDEVKQKLAKSTRELGPPKVQIENNGLTLRISGSCSAPYFVILTYRDRDKYLKKPRSFASNYAGVCANSRFDYTVNHLPIDTPPGTYYLLLAEQEEDGPWVPASLILPIEISLEEVEVGG